jgi:hypothetical protein
MVEFTRVCIAQARGDAAVLQPGLDTLASGDEVIEAYLLGIRARVAPHGDPSAGRMAVESAFRSVATAGLYDDATAIWLSAVQVVRDAADWNALRELVDFIEAHDGDPAVGLKAVVSWASALLADIDDRPSAEVEAHFQAALVQSGRWGARPVQARIHADFGRWLAGQSRADDAAAQVEAARTELEVLRATAWLDELDAALVRTSV